VSDPLFKRNDIVKAAIPMSKPVRAEVLRHMRGWVGVVYEIRILSGRQRFTVTHIAEDKLDLLLRDGKPPPGVQLEGS
jgi:hypothetical protein